MNKKILIGIVIGVLLLGVIGFSYSFFTTSIIGTGQENTVTAGTLELQYIDGPGVSLSKAYPGQSITKVVSVKNIGTLDAEYDLIFKDLINEIEKDELVVSYTCTSYKDYVDSNNKGTVSGTCNNLTNQVVPFSETIIDSTISTNITIVKDITHEYTFTITFKEINDNQNYNQGKHFSAKINATQVDNGNVEHINKESLKILAIGNSFSDDSLQYVYQIAENLGYENIKLGNLFIAGCTLETHLSNAQNDSASYTYRTNTDGTWSDNNSYKMSTAIQSEDWDYITFQQGSPVSGLSDTYDDLSALVEIVKPMSGDAELAWHMTWAYDEDSTHSGFANYGNDQMTMYNAILSAVQTKVVTNDDIKVIIPVGTAIQNARTSYLVDDLTRDGYHMSYEIGRYIAGVSFLRGLTGVSVDELTYKPDGLDDLVRKVAIESANNAVSNKYQVTQSKYTSDIDIDNYELVTLNLTKGAYYSSAQVAGEDWIVPPTLNDSTNDHSGGGIYVRFWATQVFTEETLPVGSIITVASGWQYRPDGWNDDSYNTTSTRPANVTTSKVVIDEAWWEDYQYRGFNISKTTTADITSLTEEDINNIFKIYVPKN